MKTSDILNQVPTIIEIGVKIIEAIRNGDDGKTVREVIGQEMADAAHLLALDSKARDDYQEEFDYESD